MLPCEQSSEDDESDEGQVDENTQIGCQPVEHNLIVRLEREAEEVPYK
jgi:hypothetical protein